MAPNLLDAPAAAHPQRARPPRGRAQARGRPDAEGPRVAARDRPPVALPLRRPQHRRAAADRPQPRQQELHPRPAAREQHGPLPRRRGLRRLPARLGGRRAPPTRRTRSRPTAPTSSRARIAAACEEADAEELTLMGYCFGGDLVLLTAAIGAGDLPIRNVVTLTTPCDFRSIGFLADMFLDGPPGRRRHHRRHRPRARRGHGRRLPVDQADRPARAAAEPVGPAVERGADRELPRALRLDARPDRRSPARCSARRSTLLVRDNALASGEVPFAGGTSRG